MSRELSETEQDRFRAHKLLSQGYSKKAVAAKLSRSTHFVRNAEKRFEQRADFKDLERSGRPKKLSARDQKRLVKVVKGKKAKSVRRVSAQFKTKEKAKVSRETVRMTLKKVGLFPHRRRKTPRLTEDHKKRRVAMAKKYRRFDWSKCAFWDESGFDLYPTPNLKNDIVWDEKGVEYRYEKMAHPPSFTFGAAITVHGPTRLVPYEGKINSDTYIEMVDKVIPDINKMFKGENWTWVQDGARPHVSRKTLKHLAEVCPDVFPPEEWAPNSPDENPAENSFGYLDAKVQEKGAQSLRVLKTTVTNAWKEITPEFCKKAIEAIPKRLKQIIETGGEYVYELKKTKDTKE
jgi:transposase